MLRTSVTASHVTCSCRSYEENIGSVDLLMMLGRLYVQVHVLLVHSVNAMNPVHFFVMMTAEYQVSY